MQLFTEVFPLTDAPLLAAYAMILDADYVEYEVDPQRVGRRLARQLADIYPGHWLWQNDQLLTDQPRTAVELMIAVDALREELPDTFSWVDSVEPVADFAPTPLMVADFVIRAHLKGIAPKLDPVLATYNTTIKATPGDGDVPVHIERDYRWTPWDVRGDPAIALSITARVVFGQDLATFVRSLDETNAVVGLRVNDRTTDQNGEVIRVMGLVGDRRDKLMAATRKPALQKVIERAPDDELVVKVAVGRRQSEFPASALAPLIRPSDFPLFGINTTTANAALRPDPVKRSQMVKALSDIAKDAGILDRAYNAREREDLFYLPEFEPYVRFANKRTRPYTPASVRDDFWQFGAFSLRDEYAGEPIKVAVVNALTMKIEDFVEAMQRQLARQTAFAIDVVRERRVRVVSLANLDAAVKVVEDEAPDIILAFLPDAAREETAEDLPAYVKSLTLGRGIPAHVIFESTLNDPASMTEVIMGVLARTGNTPYALADKLDFADFVVGLDVVRKDEKDGATQITAIARVYRNDGEFVRFAVREVTVDEGKLPFVLMRDLFPQRDFAGKRIVIHHDDVMAEDTRQALLMWGQAIQAAFFPVEIVRRGAPRLYAFDAGQVVAPPVGAAFVPNDREAFVVLAHDPDQPTPQPLHILATGLSVQQAVLSVQQWTLLYYGSLTEPQLPASTVSAGELAYWLRRGGRFNADTGSVPFWL